MQCYRQGHAALHPPGMFPGNEVLPTALPASPSGEQRAGVNCIIILVNTSLWVFFVCLQPGAGSFPVLCCSPAFSASLGHEPCAFERGTGMERCGCRGLFLQDCGAAAWLEQSPGTPKARGDPSPEGKGIRGAACTISPLDHHSQICLLSPLPALNSLPSPGLPPMSCFPSHSAEGLQLWDLSFLPWPLQAGWDQWGQVSVVQVNIGLNTWVWWCPVS